MDQVKSIISPAGRRKKLELATGDTGGSITMAAKTRTSGIPVKELMARVPASANVPQVLSRICKYIYKFGKESQCFLNPFFFLWRVLSFCFLFYLASFSLSVAACFGYAFISSSSSLLHAVLGNMGGHPPPKILVLDISE